MAEQSIPQFIDERYPDDDYYDEVVAPSPPPVPKLDAERAEQRRRIFAPKFDLYLVAVVGLLCAIGLLIVYSASIDASFLATEDQSTTYFFQRQLRNFVIGIVVLYVMARIDYRIWRRFSVWMMLVVIAALLVVLQFGDTRLAAQRALYIAGNSFQPGEAAKFVIVIYMAAWLAAKRRRLSNVTYGLIPFSIMVGAVAFLIVLQPDLSTAASILATALTMFFLAGASWAQLAVITGAAAFAGYTIATQFSYASERINDHLAAIRDLTQASDHVQAAVTAFINGGLFGVGLGEGRQKFGRLPFPHTDSVFAVIGEELGLFGCTVVIGLYVMLVYRGFTVSRNARDPFGALLAAGVTCWLTYDALLNIAVMTALVPPTGVPLPFISFGGSSLIAAMAGVGLMLSVSRVSAMPEPVEEKQIEAWDEEPTKKKKRRQVKEERKQAKQQLKRDKAVEKAREQRRRQRRSPRQQSEAAKAEEPRLEPEGIPDVEKLAPSEEEVQQANHPPSPETEELLTEEEEQRDANSHVGGRNRRRRISRISCR
jgi:cell division protein FtsW